ncbi:copper homeostasis protein CutC [Paenibacillus sp. IHBB 10380]|uniref:copper homeostasis protein CutC n=1 Tax=Paenibacillus sp. IHBB 10380 TaxID=1566358 RepID=UPI000AD15AA8|nr:copper homeostasis protein CutC [Paenibacillus sp. IHBB 10380]
MMLLEVIATTVGDAIMAERGGADRIELITGISEGGLTPSLALIEKVREAVSIPVRVMVRPHARSFQYDEEDIETMRRDIVHIGSVGGLDLVMGMLRHDGTVDEENLKILLDAANGIKVTFHRAFDEVRNQAEALDVLSQYPEITDILTSGGCKTAPEGADQLAKLVRLTAGQSISILAGAGLTEQGLESFLRQSGVSRVHFGSAVRQDGDPLKPINPEYLQHIRTIINEWKR